MKTLNREKIVKIPILGNVIFLTQAYPAGVLLGWCRWFPHCPVMGKPLRRYTARSCGVLFPAWPLPTCWCAPPAAAGRHRCGAGHQGRRVEHRWRAICMGVNRRRHRGCYRIWGCPHRVTILLVLPGWYTDLPWPGALSLTICGPIRASTKSPAPL